MSNKEQFVKNYKFSKQEQAQEVFNAIIDHLEHCAENDLNHAYDDYYARLAIGKKHVVQFDNNNGEWAYFDREEKTKQTYDSGFPVGAILEDCVTLEELLEFDISKLDKKKSGRSPIFG